jgi:ADP-L-glycero-D-manno-heptose 6-epimerase
MKVVVTGAAGFIGANLVHGLNARGIDDILAVDDLTDGSKHLNLAGASIADYIDHDEFYGRFERGEFGRADIVFHQGACSDTMVHDGRYMMQANYRCSKRLLDACLASGTRLIYASSAAVYGASTAFREEPACEQPLNVYGYSKLLFDQVVRRALPTAAVQVAGLRYFNVYGPREQHKGRMASVAFHQHGQFARDGHVNLFGAYGGFDAGEQRRDFVFVDDVVAVNLWLLEHPDARGIFNVGSGRAQPFNDVAQAVVNAGRAGAASSALTLAAQVEQGLVRYVDFPAALVGKYQCHTQADLTRLRSAGCNLPFLDVAAGVARYMRWLSAQGQEGVDAARQIGRDQVRTAAA